MTGSTVAYVATVILALEALVMHNHWALAFGLLLAVTGILIED